MYIQYQIGMFLEYIVTNFLQLQDDISSLIKEQQLLEARIQQEEADRLLAEALQRELNQRPQVND